MCPVTDNPTSCEIRNVFHFLHAKSMSAVEIHYELCTIHGQNVMFKDGRTNVHDEE
jgi:hypothetical protein